MRSLTSKRTDGSNHLRLILGFKNCSESAKPQDKRMKKNVTSVKSPTCFPSKVYSFLTTPVSSFIASVISVRTCSNEWAVFLFKSTRTAFRGFTPLRMMVTSLGRTKSLFSFAWALLLLARD